jgi:hypothetical protein
MKAFLAEWINKAELPRAIEAQALPYPEDTLPDEIYIPSDCPNDVESIQTCIDCQRIKLHGHKNEVV